MKIKNKLLLGGLISGTLIGFFVLSIYQLTGDVGEELKKTESVDELLKGTTELAIIGDQYIAHKEARTEQLWHLKFDAIMECTIKNEDLPFSNEIMNDLKSLNKSFYQLKTNYYKRRELLRGNASKEQIETNLIFEDRLASRMRVDSTRIWSNAFQIAKESRQRTYDAQRRANSRIAILATLLFSVMAITVVTTIRTITKPIGEFIKGTEIVGEGNLEHRIKIISNDEIGYLSLAFNNMVEKRMQIENALKESKKLLSSAIEHAPIGMVLVKPDGYFYSANQAFCNIVGYSEDELQNMTFQDITHPEDYEVGRNIVKELSEGKAEKGSIEKRYIHKNGDIILVHLTTTLLRDEGGNPQYFFIQAEDITKRREMEGALKASEKKYFTIVEKGNDGIIIIQNGLLRFVNQKMMEMSGFTMDEMIGKPFTDFISPEYEELVLERYKKRVKGKDIPKRYEIEVFSKGGRKIPVEINASLIEHEGSPADMAIIRDITQRKEAEEKIREYSENLEQKVKERTAELEEKTKELERFNRLFVGRELRIGELKEEIKGLKEEIEKAKGGRRKMNENRNGGHMIKDMAERKRAEEV